MSLVPTGTERGLAIQWVAAVVIGWIIGFYLCGVIEEFLSTFLVDGLVIGSAIGIAQALVIRRRGVRSLLWVVMSIIGFGIGKFFADSVAVAISGPLAMVVSGAIIGLVAGTTQAVALADRFARPWAWVPANVLGWAAGWGVIGLAEGSIESLAMTYVIGSVGAAIVGVITAIALIGLFRQPSPATLPADPETPAQP